MFFTLNPADGRPVYLQIIDQVRTAMAAGRLRKDDRPPPIGQLAETLRVNRNTVAKAYQMLERDGIVVSRKGVGTFVTNSDLSISERERRSVVAEKIDPYPGAEEKRAREKIGKNLDVEA